MGYLDSNDPDILAYTNQLRQQTQTPPGALNQIDPKWLALAQGFLAPTRTGGFGESLGNAAGQLQGPLSQMKQQQMSAMEKIAALKETQARLALAKEKQEKDANPENDYINNEYKRALTLKTNIDIVNGIRSKYLDPLGMKFVNEAAEAEFKKEAQPFLDKVDALHGRSRPGGVSSIENATSGGGAPGSINVPNPTVTTTPRQGEPQPAPTQGGLPKVMTKQQYDNLPMGSTYYAPDGTLRQKFETPESKKQPRGE